MSNKKALSVFKKIPAALWLGLIILFAVVRLVFLFNARDGHHVDETWSYGFANSYYDPQIYYDFNVSDDKNYGEWISGEVFKDYITVSPDHRFAFDSVIYNSRVDLSPPLYILVLHFVCSFFPGTFSWWYAFSISLFCYILSLILIYLISTEITDSKFCGFLSVIYYILSGCGTANFLFLRVYHMFTLFALALFWLITKIIKCRKGNCVPYFICLLIPSILGYLTHFYFLVIAFAFTLFGALALLIKKRWRSSLCLCLIMLLSVVCFFVIYPESLRLLLPYSSGDTSSTGYYTYPYYFDLNIANIRFFTGTIGFAIRFSIFDVITVLGAIVLITILAALVCFLFRNEQWMKKIIAGAKKTFVKVYGVLKSFFKQFDISILVALLSVLFYLFVIPYSATLTNMGFTERYFFPAMAVFIIVYVSLAGVLIRNIFNNASKRKILCYFGVVAIFTVLALQNYRSDILTHMFRFDTMDDKSFTAEVDGKDCYVVIKSGRDMIYLSPILMHSDNVYVDYQKFILEEDYVFPQMDKECLFILLKEDLLTDEEKEEYKNDMEFAQFGLTPPETAKTIEDIIREFEEQSGYSYELINEHPAFIGMTDVYGSVDE